MKSARQWTRIAKSAPTPSAALSAWARAFEADPVAAALDYADALIVVGKPEAAVPILLSRVDASDEPARTRALLGEAYTALGETHAAIEHFQYAVLFDPSSAALHNNLCAAYLDAGDSDRALQSGERAVELDKEYFEARINLSNAYCQAGRVQDAAEQARIAAELDPTNPEVWERMGLYLRMLNKLTEARDAFAEFARLDPRNGGALFKLGLAELDVQDWASAAESFRRATALLPDPAEACAKMGMAYYCAGRHDRAAGAYRQALTLKPDDEDSLVGLPMTYLDKGQLDEALRHIECALERTNRSPRAKSLMAIYLQQISQLERAEALAREALQDAPMNVDLHHNLSQLLLATGQYEEGWPENEWRMLTIGAARGLRDASGNEAGHWDGTPMPGKILTVVHEQGFGDTLLFARYLSMVRERVGTLKVICPSAIAPVIEYPGIDELISFAEGAPLISVPTNAQILFCGLPNIFGTRLDTIPPTPYLAADPERVTAWKQQFAEDGDAFKVGLVWKGGKNFRADGVRSPGLAALGPLADVDGVRFYSFQKGPGRDQLPQCPSGLELTDLSLEIHDFGDTAAALHGMDLLISSCTSIVHLAGGLGLPVWVALHSSPYWLWMLDREDSPWYPSARLFRQPTCGDWAAVYRRIADELRLLVAKRRLSA